MTVNRYDPFRDLRSLQDEVNRLFTGNVGRTFDDEGIARGSWHPSVDIYENKEQIVLEAELPGMNRDDFDLSIENNVITLRGERRFEKKETPIIITALSAPTAASRARSRCRTPFQERAHLPTIEMVCSA